MEDILFSLQKLFSVVFIFAITGINLWLVGSFLYWKNVFSKDKKCILSSIAMSDLLIGLFCQTVEVALHFEIYLGGPGCALSYVQVYSRFFCPFVYGVGLTLLSFELILNEKGKSFYRWSKYLTFLMAWFPWLITILVIIPLTFVGASKTSCWYFPKNIRGICIWVISNCVPTILCLMTWVFSACIMRKAAYSCQLPATCSLSKFKSNEQQSGPVCQSLLKDKEEADESSMNCPEGKTLTDAGSSFHPQSTVTADSTEASNISSGHSLLVIENQPSSTTPNTHALEEQTVNIETKMIKSRREKVHLLLVIVVFVSLNIPFALYNLMELASFLYGNNSFTSVWTFSILKWLQSSRSFFVPLSWSIIFYIEKSKMLNF